MAGCATDKAFTDADKDKNGRLTLDEVDVSAAQSLKKSLSPKAPKAAGKIDPYLKTLLRTLK